MHKLKRRHPECQRVMTRTGPEAYCMIMVFMCFIPNIWRRAWTGAVRRRERNDVKYSIVDRGIARSLEPAIFGRGGGRKSSTDGPSR